jgi:DNA-binding beta-propeller fold protein YncE
MSIRCTAKLFAILLAMYGTGASAQPDVGPMTAQSFEVEAQIPLGDVRSWIDHMAIDLSRQRLLVAELENDSVGIVDLKDRKVVRSLTGLKHPQGVGYMASTDTLYVANAGDGSVRLYQGADYASAGTIDLGDDADTVRVDGAAGRNRIWRWGPCCDRWTNARQGSKHSAEGASGGVPAAPLHWTDIRQCSQ